MSRETQKERHDLLVMSFFLVEVRGVEPLSENNSTGPSPGADGYLGRRYRPVPLPLGKPSRLRGQVRVMMRGRVNSFPPHGRHINDALAGLWPLRLKTAAFT